MYSDSCTMCKKFLIRFAMARAWTLTRPNPPSEVSL